MRAATNLRRRAFTLLELLVVIAIVSLLIAILIPALSAARENSRRVACLSNQRQVGTAARMYMDDYSGEMFHHHEGWVLDDGSQVDELPASVAGCDGGGAGNSHAEKPWVIFFQPYLANRKVGFCPSDPTPRSEKLAMDLMDYNGGIQTVAEEPPPGSEFALAAASRRTMVSYLLNSIFTHRSCRYALEGVLIGFATDSKVIGRSAEIVLFAERNSEALNAEDNEEYGSVTQDDYDTWVGEPALVRWGSGRYGDQGWIRYNRHGRRANYVFTDGHADSESWSVARVKQFPDGVVRAPLADPLP